MQFLKMTEKLNRYMNKQRKTVHANSTNTIQKLANWKPIKIPPQVILLRLQCVLEKHKSQQTKETEEANPSSSSSSSLSETLPKELCEKVEELQFLLHHTPEQCIQLRDKRSHCFWCTCSFENASYFIPCKIQSENNEVSGYGHFCSPNCALASLYSEDISVHEKHERDQLIHVLFSPEGSKEKFRPSPDPRLLLDKFSGTLSPEEYRQLFQSEMFIYPMNFNVTRQWKEIPEMTDSKLCQFYGKDFQGFRTGFNNHRSINKKVSTVPVT